MATINIFESDAFSLASLMAALDKVPFNPSMLGDLGIFSDRPVTTETVYVEERSGTLSLVQTTPRGAPLAQRTTEKRDAVPFKTSRIAKQDKLWATELQNIRDFGSETELMRVAKEVMRRMSGETGLQAEIGYTWENMRLGAIQGIVLDADGSTIQNFYTAFNISQPAEIAFDLTGAQAAGTTVGAAGKLRPFIQQNVVRPMVQAAKGAFQPTTRIYGLCGHSFYDDLTNHGEVRATYLNQAAAAEQRNGNAFESFTYGGVTWIDYRGSDDNSAIAINADKVKFFPVGAPGIFQAAWSPAEFMPYVNTPGTKLYPMIVPDDDRQAYVDIEVYSYPLFMCTRPDVLFRGKRGA